MDILLVNPEGMLNIKIEREVKEMNIWMNLMKDVIDMKKVNNEVTDDRDEPKEKANVITGKRMVVIVTHI